MNSFKKNPNLNFILGKSGGRGGGAMFSEFSDFFLQRIQT